ncbi:MAG: hypothetical protein D6790_20370, partial [Caldilineae bacterium]
MHRTIYDYQPRRSFWGNLASLLESSAATVLSLILIPALLAVALLLPPVSLLERIQALTYTTIPESGATLMDPDGTAVVFPGEAVETPFRASLDSIPRADFLSGAAGEPWREALAALPDSLIPKSPVYRLDVRGESPDLAIVRIPIPNDSEPYETLDLYTWTDGGWHYLPSKILRAEDLIESDLEGSLPTNFIVMQTTKPLPRVAVDVGLAGQTPPGAEQAVTRVMAAGLYLRGDGALDGNVIVPPGGNFEIVPVLRNWKAGEMPRIDLLNNMLIDPGLMDNQLNAVMDLLTANFYPGVVIDYRGV